MDFKTFINSKIQPDRQSPLSPLPRQPFQQQPQQEDGGLALIQRLAEIANAEAQSQAIQHRPSSPSRPDARPIGNRIREEAWTNGNIINPNAMASTEPVAGPPVPQPQEKVHGQAEEGEGYYFVEFTDASGSVSRFFVPESYAETLPQNARVTGEIVTNPQVIENARSNGALLEQQPPEVGSFFRNTKTSEQTYQEATSGIERPDSSGTSTVVGAELTPKQRQDLNSQKVVVWTVDEVEANDPELAAVMRASGITELATDEVLVPQDNGTYVKVKKSEQYATAGQAPKQDRPNNPEPVGTELPGLKREDIRARGMEDVANQMEAAGIYQVNDGDVLIMGSDGKVKTVPVGTVPDSEVIVYGGRSTPVSRPDGGNLGAIMNVLDTPRQWAVEKAAEYVATRDSDDAPFWVKVMKHTPGAQFFEGAVDVTGTILPQHLEENTMLPGLDFAMWMENNPEEAEAAYRDGYTDPESGETFTGYRAVWEKYSSSQPLLQRVGNDLAFDPLNYSLGTGGALRTIAKDVAGDAARTAVPRRIVSSALDSTGRVLQAPDQLIDNAISAGVGRTLGPNSRLGRSAVGQQLSRPFRLSPETRVVNQAADAREITSDILARLSRNEPTPASTGIDPPITTTASADVPFNGQLDTALPPATVASGDVPLAATVADNGTIPAGTVDNPFAGMKNGEAPHKLNPKDWDFLSPRDRAEIGLDETNRIIDEIWQKHGNTPEYRRFGEIYEPRGKAFIERERELWRQSVDGRSTRGGFDFSHARRSQLDEAAHILNDLIPAYREAFGSAAEIPAYRFKTKWREPRSKTASPFARQRDDALIERAVFGEDEIATGAFEQIQRLAARNPEWQQGGDILGRIQQYRQQWLQHNAQPVPVEASVRPSAALDSANGISTPLPQSQAAGINQSSSGGIQLPERFGGADEVIPPSPSGNPLTREVNNPFYVPESEASSFVSHDSTQVRRFMGRNLSEREVKVIDTSLSDGSTIGSRWEQYADDLEGTMQPGSTVPLGRADAEQMAAERVVEDYTADLVRTEMPNKAQVYDRAVERLSKKHPELDQSVIKTRAFIEATEKSPRFGLKQYDTSLAILREMTLYNSLTGYRYIMTQGVGNTITALLTGNLGIVSSAFAPRNLRGAYREMNQDTNDWVYRMLSRFVEEPLTPSTVSTAAQQNAQLPAHLLHDDADHIIAELGFGGARHDVSRVIRDQVTEATVNDTRLYRTVDNLRLGRVKLPAKVTGIFANKHIRDIANSLDMTMRKTLYAHTMKANVAEATPAFRAMMRDYLPEGSDVARFDQLWDEMPVTFGSDRVLDTFGEFGERYAHGMSRDWQNTLNKMDGNARKEVSRVFFSGDKTNLDEALGRVFFFHYWMSRAIPLYTTSLLRNPGMLNAYIGMHQEMEEQARSGKYGPAVNGFLRAFGTYSGFNIFIRPDAFFQTVFALGDANDWEPENESGLGSFLRRFPFFVNPIVNASVNYAGYSGNTFAPDPLQLGIWGNFVTNGLNLIDAHFGDGEVNQNAWQNFNSWLRSNTSGHLPGSTQIPYQESTIYAQRDINFLILEIAEDQGLDPKDPFVLAAMDDSDNPLHREAYKRYANGQGMQQLSRILPTSVLYPKFRVARGDETRYGINQGTPNGTDENQLWRDQRAVAQITDPQSRTLWTQGDEYYGLGTDEQRRSYSMYNSIRYGSVQGQVEINGVMVTELQLSRMSEEQRAAAADTWATQNNATEDIETIRTLRKEYRESHPEWNEYVSWSGTVRDADGGVDGYWNDITGGDPPSNPNTARWYESNIHDGMRKEDRERKLTSPDAFMAIHGIQSDMYEPAPISTNNGAITVPYTPAPSQQPYSSNGTGNTSGSATTPQTIRDDMAKYERETAEYNAAAGVNMNGLNPMARSAYQSNLEDQGIYRPRLSNRAALYLEWAQQQPEGSDTSPEEYVRWLEHQGQ